MAESLVANVSQWSQEQCEEALYDVLPKLITIFNEEDSLQMKIDILNALTNSFLPCLQIEEVEDKLFSQIIPKVPAVFNELIHIISSPNRSDIKELRSDLLQMACQLHGNLMLCINFLGSDEVSLNKMYSLPKNIVQVLAISYNHCKDSFEIYGEMLELLSEPLGIFFKKTHALQMDLLMLLERMTLPFTTEKNVQILSDICSQIAKLCQQATRLDVKIAASLWKTYTKLITRHQNCLKNCLDVDHVLKYLSAETEEGILNLKLYLNDGTEEDDFNQTLKICSFNIKLIITICETFQGYLGDCIQELFHLVLMLYSLVRPCLLVTSLKEKEVASIQSCLIIAIDPLVFHLLGNREFIYFVQRPMKQDALCDLHLSLCLLRISVLDKLTESKVVDELGTNNFGLSIFEGIFTSLQACQVEMFLPIYIPDVMFKRKPQRMVSFYEHVCTHLCAFVANLLACQFHCLETFMLKTLLCCTDISVCLICDIWCFLARFGSAQLCYSHCSLLARIASMVSKGPSLSWIKFLLGRLMRFLSIEQKENFLQEHQHLIHDAFFSDLFINMKITECESSIHLQDSVTDITVFTDLYLLEQQLTDLIHTLRWRPSVMVQNMALKLIIKWSKLIPKICNTSYGSALTFAFLEIATLLVSSVEQSGLLELLKFVKSLWESGDDALQYAVLSFLKEWTKKHITPCEEKTHILSQLAVIFAKAITSSNYLLKQEALYVFSELAYSTPHHSVVTECLKIAPDFQDIFASFLNKFPENGYVNKHDKKCILEQQISVITTASIRANAENVDNVDKCNIQPMNNKPTEKDHIEEQMSDITEKHCSSEFHQYIENIADSIQRLKALQPLPESVLNEAKALAQKMNKLY